MQNQQFEGFPYDEGSALGWFIVGAAAAYIYLKVSDKGLDSITLPKAKVASTIQKIFQRIDGFFGQIYGSSYKNSPTGFRITIIILTILVGAGILSC